MTKTASIPKSFGQALAQARQHDGEAIAMLYHRALPTMYRYVALRLHSHPELVEDVVADVFLTMVESIGALRAETEGGFFGWLIAIAHAKVARAIDHRVRQRQRLQPLPEDSGEVAALGLTAHGQAADPAPLYEWQELLGEVGQAMDVLTPDQQTVVVGRFLAGLSISTLAEALQKPPATIRSLQFRALTALATHLGEPRTPRSRHPGGQL